MLFFNRLSPDHYYVHFYHKIPCGQGVRGLFRGSVDKVVFYTRQAVHQNKYPFPVVESVGKLNISAIRTFKESNEKRT